MAKKDAQTTQYEALRRIRHNGEYYAAGDAIQLNDAEAKSLLEVKAVKPFPVEAKASTTPPAGGKEDGTTTPPVGGQNGDDTTPPAA